MPWPCGRGISARTRVLSAETASTSPASNTRYITIFVYSNSEACVECMMRLPHERDICLRQKHVDHTTRQFFLVSVGAIVSPLRKVLVLARVACACVFLCVSEREVLCVSRHTVC